MNGLLKPTKGEVLINGVSTKGKTTATIARKVAYVFQNPDDQLFNQEVLAEISYTPRYFKVDEETVNKILKKAVKSVSYTHRRFSRDAREQGGKGLIFPQTFARTQG